jgi:uncharacterized membrane protein YGL010W
VNAPVTADDWADRYGEIKASGPGAASAWLGIPLVVATLIGMLWSVPVPTVLAGTSPAINVATLFLMATFVYYCILSLPLAFGGLLFLIAAALPSAWLTQAGLPLWQIASALFAPVFCWQLLESRRATGRLLIVRNLQYLMLGPIWLLRALYRQAGIAY